MSMDSDILQSENTNKEESGNSRKKLSTIPISRVNAIMRSCPNLTTVKNDAVALTAHAAELFIQDLVKKAYQNNPDKTFLSYNSLADYISDSDYSFLKDAIPKKITVSQYNEIVKNKSMS